MAVDALSVSVVLGGSGFTILSQMSGTITSAQMIDPYVPADGTMNVTGSLNSSLKLSTDATGVALQASAGAGNIASIRSFPADGASAVGWRIEANTDFTTAGAKIASFGDNAGTSYAEKAFVDLNGGGSFATLSATGVTAAKSAAYTATVADSLVLADPNAAAGSFAITLPAATRIGQLLTVKVVATHATRVITVIRAGADTIEGVTAGQTTTTFTTTAILGSATFQSDGSTKWYLIASNGTIT